MALTETVKVVAVVEARRFRHWWILELACGHQSVISLHTYEHYFLNMPAEQRVSGCVLCTRWRKQDG